MISEKEAKPLPLPSIAFHISLRCAIYSASSFLEGSFALISSQSILSAYFPFAFSISYATTFFSLSMASISSYPYVNLISF
jgi:hypothetical protein